MTAESADELNVMLSGEKGSSTMLSVQRQRADGTLAKLDRLVKREKIGEASAVPAVFMLDAGSGTGYVRITSFMNEKVADDLHDALGKLEGKGMHRLILDLRDNGGGSVSEAAHVAGEFLPKGTIVYTSEGRKVVDTDTGRVSRSFWKSERRYPIVLLVNAGTASASELVAGALQDHDRALIVGHTTFGKSLLMRGFPIADGSIIELVVGHVRTPCGRIIQRQYHGVSLHDYYRLAGADRDTVEPPLVQARWRTHRVWRRRHLPRHRAAGNRRSGLGIAGGGDEPSAKVGRRSDQLKSRRIFVTGRLRSAPVASRIRHRGFSHGCESGRRRDSAGCRVRRAARANARARDRVRKMERRRILQNPRDHRSRGRDRAHRLRARGCHPREEMTPARATALGVSCPPAAPRPF